VLPLLSHLRAPVWRDETTFWRDVLVSYPADRDARYRLAKALSETGRAEDRAEAKSALAAEIAAAERSDETALLGALHLEDGDLAAAEPLLRRAVELTSSRPKGGALARYNLAVLLKRTGRTDEAARWAEDALRLEPDLAAARRLLDSLR
jgi:Flp pilus assembly protein TadD